MTHNEIMSGLIENIKTAIEQAHRTIEEHVNENGALDRFTEEYLTRARNEASTFSSEYNREALAEYRRSEAILAKERVVKERARVEATEDDELAEALANAPGPLNDRTVLELELEPE